MKISTLGSHSALDVCKGAKEEGIGTIVVAKRGREKTYNKYYKRRKTEVGEKGVVDEILILEKFSDIVKEENLAKLKGSIFVPNRSFSVYVGYENIEKRFPIPVFGNRFLLRAEERDSEKNQYFLMKEAGIRMPKIMKPEEIDRLSIVKVNEARRSYERAFFLTTSYEEYKEKSEELIRKGVITKEGLNKAVIEEFVVGAQFNFNFFYSPVSEELELLGIDTRRQTNIEGILRIPAPMQSEALKRIRMTTIEVGHIACTLRESLLEKVFEMGERLVEVCKKYYAPGIIGPFALQTIIAENEGEEIIVFDVSFRMPGSPGTSFTPYSEYLFGKRVSFGRRIAMEIKAAERKGELERITT